MALRYLRSTTPYLCQAVHSAATAGAMRAAARRSLSGSLVAQDPPPPTEKPVGEHVAWIHRNVARLPSHGIEACAVVLSWTTQNQPLSEGFPSMNIRKYLTIVHKRSYVFDSQVFDDSDVDDLEGFPRIHPRLEGRGLLYAPAFWPTRVTALQGRGFFWDLRRLGDRLNQIFCALLNGAPARSLGKGFRNTAGMCTFRRPTRPRCGSSTSRTWPTPCVSGSGSTTMGAPRRPCPMRFRGEGLRAHWAGALSPGLRWRQRNGARAERLLCLAPPPPTGFPRWAGAGRGVGPGAWPPLPPT